MQLTCPSEQHLNAFLVGAVTEDDADLICSHLDSCVNCESLASALEKRQANLLQQLHEEYRSERYLQEPEFQQLQRAIATSPSANCDTTPMQEPLDVTDRQLRDYRLVKKIGQGGMGTVYLAFHVNLGKAFAVKILATEKLCAHNSVERFRREMRAAGKVNHPNIVNASDAGDVDGLHFLVMELVEGADLGRIVRRRGPLEVADACETVRQAALGLQHAHDNGLVHRDVKPSNLMLTVNGNVKLLDLGLAGWVGANVASETTGVVDGGLTEDGHFVGTPDYMAPEQFRDDTSIDERADIYALGATLFQLLTGDPPKSHRAKNTSDGGDDAVGEPPVEINAGEKEVPTRLAKYIQLMLSRSPQERPASAKDVAAELSGFAENADLLRLAAACQETPGMVLSDWVNLKRESLATNNVAADTPPGRDRDRRTTTPPRASWLARCAAFASIVAILIGVASFLIRSGAGVLPDEPDGDAETPIASAKKVDENDVKHAILSGDAKLAASLAQRLVDQSPNHGWNHALAAMICAYGAHTGDDSLRKAYEQHRRWIAKRWAATGEGSNTIPRICCLFEDPPGNLSGMLAAVGTEKKDRPNDWRYPHSEMTLLYRLGKTSDSLAAFGQTRRVSPHNVIHAAVDQAWLALILNRLGRTGEAVIAFEKAQKMQGGIQSKATHVLPDAWFDYIELVVVLAQFNEPSAPTTEQEEAKPRPVVAQPRQTLGQESMAAKPQEMESEPGSDRPAAKPLDSEARIAWANRVISRLLKQEYTEAESLYAAGEDRQAIDWLLRCRVTLGLMIAARDDAKLRPQADQYLQYLEDTLQRIDSLALPVRAYILKLLALQMDRPWDDDLIERITDQVQGERSHRWELHHALATIRFRQGRLLLAEGHQTAAGGQTQSEVQKWLHDYWCILLSAEDGQLNSARQTLMKAEVNRSRLAPLLESESTTQDHELDTILELRWMMPIFARRLAPLQNLKHWFAGQQPAFATLDHEIQTITRQLIKTPDQADLYFQRAIAFARMRRQSQALGDFQQAASLQPDEPIYQTLQQYVASVTSDRRGIQQYAQEITEDEADFMKRLDLHDPNTAFIFRLLLVANLQDHIFTVHTGRMEALAKKHVGDWYCQYVSALWKLRTGRINEAEEQLASLFDASGDSSLEQFCTLYWIDWFENLKGEQDSEQRTERARRLSELQRKTQYNAAHVAKSWLAVYESMLLSTGTQEPLRRIVQSQLMRTIAAKGVSIAFDITHSGLPDSWFNINASAMNWTGTRCVFAPLRSNHLCMLEIASGKLVDFPSGGEVRCLAFTGDGKSLIVGRPNKNIDVIDIALKRPTPLAVSYQPNSLSHHGRGNQLAVAFQAKRAEIWDLATNTISQPPTLLLGVPRRIEFNPGGTRIAVSMSTEHTSVFSDTLAPIAELPHVGHFAWINDHELCCSRDDSGHLTIVDLADPNRPKTFANSSTAITALAYLKPRRLVVTANDHGVVRGWSLDGEPTEIGHLPRALIRDLSHSGDGRYLLVTGQRHRQGDGGSCCTLFDLQSI